MTTLLTRVRNGSRDEHGIAMITALMAVLVASLLGAVVMNLSMHTTQASAYDRARTQSIHAAEAGLDQAMSHFASAAITTLPCTISGVLNATPVANWSVTITYYTSFPLVGTPMTCVNGFLTGTTAPGGAALESTGSVVGWRAGTVERHMQSEVSLSPVHGAFNKAIFSDQSPSITNNITVYGEHGNDADFLSNSNWSCTNSLMIYGNIYVQGTASMSNSCHTAADLWARDALSMSSSSRVDHDAKSSTGGMTMTNSSSVGGSIQLAGTCGTCSGRYGGTLTTGYTQPPPPSTPYPTMTFDAAAWTADGWAIQYYTDCTAAANWVLNSANNATKAVIRITGGCTFNLGNNKTVSRTADLAIFTDGEITTSNNTTFQTADSNWHSLYLIVETAASCAGTDGRITMSNLTSFTGMYFFIFSPCYSTFANNNSTARGQVYGEVVAVGSNLTFTFHAMLVPGAGDITGYTAKVQFIREVN